MSQPSFEQQLAEANARLHQNGLEVTLVEQEDALSLQGLFPPQPDSEETAAHLQDIALPLKPVTADLPQAETIAQAIGAALKSGQFDWTNYIEEPGQGSDAKQRTVAEWMQAMAQAFIDGDPQPSRRQAKWNKEYVLYLKRLPPTEMLTIQVLEAAVKQTKPNSATRQKICRVYRQFGEFAGLEVESLDWLKGVYLPRTLDLGTLPTDEVIVQEICQIPQPQWRWVAGMMATYGLRPQELVDLDTEHLAAGGIR